MFALLVWELIWIQFCCAKINSNKILIIVSSQITCVCGGREQKWKFLFCFVKNFNNSINQSICKIKWVGHIYSGDNVVLLESCYWLRWISSCNNFITKVDNIFLTKSCKKIFRTYLSASSLAKFPNWNIALTDDIFYLCYGFLQLEKALSYLWMLFDALQNKNLCVKRLSSYQLRSKVRMLNTEEQDPAK